MEMAFLTGVSGACSGDLSTPALSTSTDAGGEVYCRGSNDFGKLGSNTRTWMAFASPQKVKNMMDLELAFFQGSWSL